MAGVFSPKNSINKPGLLQIEYDKYFFCFRSVGNDSVSGGSTGVSVGHHAAGHGGPGGVSVGGGVAGDIKPRSLRFTWSMKTTSSRDPNEIMAEIKKVRLKYID